MGVAWRIARGLLLLGLILWGTTVVAVLVFSARALEQHGLGRSIDRPVDAALVLGGGVDGDGLIGYSSRRRVWTAVDALKTGKAERLIFSGGQPNPKMRTPADRMAEYAERLGADPERLIVERHARSTFENLRFSFEIAEERGLQRLAIVTDAYHLARARALARYYGREDIDLIAAPGLRADTLGNRAWSIGREALAWWYNLYKVATWEVLGALGWDEAERMEVIR